MSFFINNGMHIGGQAQVRADALAGGVGAQATSRPDPDAAAATAIERALRLIAGHRADLASPDVAAAELTLAKAELTVASPDRHRILEALRRAATHVGEVAVVATAVQHAAETVRAALTG